MIKQKPKNTILSIIAIAALLVILELIGRSKIDHYYIRILQYWSIYIIYGASFQLLYGYTGLLSLGHAGLIAIGAYVVGIFTISPATKAMSFLLQPPAPFISNVQIPFIPALIIGGFFAALFGLVVAAPALRLGGDYLAIVTMGFAEVIRLLIVNMPSIFNGAMGLRAIPQSATLLMTWSVAIVCLFVMKRFENSTYGRALLAINEDEIGAEALGINVFSNKVKAFVLSSFFAGIGGGLMASVLGTIDPNTFKSTLTYTAVTICVLGGIRSATGVIIASGIYSIMSEFLRVFESPIKIGNLNFSGMPGMRVLVFGIMLLFLMLFRREGLLGSKEFSWDWFFSLFKKKPPKEHENTVNADKMGGSL